MSVSTDTTDPLLSLELNHGPLDPWKHGTIELESHHSLIKTTTTPISTTVTDSTNSSLTTSMGEMEWQYILLIVVSVIIISILVIYIVFKLCKHFENKRQKKREFISQFFSKDKTHRTVDPDIDIEIGEPLSHPNGTNSLRNGLKSNGFRKSSQLSKTFPRSECLPRIKSLINGHKSNTVEDNEDETGVTKTDRKNKIRDEIIKSFEILDKNSKKSGSDHLSNISSIAYDRSERAERKKTSDETQRSEEPSVRPKPLPRTSRTRNRRMDSVSEQKTNPKTFEMHSNYETIGVTQDKEKDSPLIVVKMNENFDFIGREVNFKSLDPKIKQMANSLDKNYCYFIQNIKK